MNEFLYMEELCEEEIYTTFPFVITYETEHIEVNRKYYLGQLWSGEENLSQLLESKAAGIGGSMVVDFEIIDLDKNNILFSVVEITNIY